MSISIKQKKEKKKIKPQIVSSLLNKPTTNKIAFLRSNDS